VQKPRLVALDAFRGLAIAGMILVNSPGSWDHVYAPLRHASWHGCTPTDLIFPFFLFVTGAALHFAFRQTGAAAFRAALPRILRRVVLLFLIGMLLNWFAVWPPLAELRIMGVLQRIAIAWGVAAVIVLTLGQTARLTVAAGILVGYWLLLVLGGGVDPYALESNLVRQVDLAILGAPHMYSIGGIAFDPEGLLSTVPSVVSVLLGYELAGLMPGNAASGAVRPGAGRLAVAGAMLAVAGLALATLQPINKSLWTVPYVLFTSGISALVLAAMASIARVAGGARWLKPLAIYGENPLLLYILAWLLVATLERLWYVTLPDGSVTVAGTAAFLWFANWLPLEAASVAVALLQVALFGLVAWILHRRRLLVRL
jgi:predicted acyltransferase